MAGGLNRTRARELWERAAALGDTEAVYLLGQLHEAGTIVKRNATRFSTDMEVWLEA